MVLKECRRVLRPGGLLYVLTPNQARLINRFRLLLGRSVYYPMDYWLGDSDEHITRDDRRVYAGHIREYTLSEVLKMLKYAGFEVQGTQMLAAQGTSSREHLSPSRFLLRSYNVLERMLPSSAYMISVAAIRPSHE